MTEERLQDLERKYEGFKVYDNTGEKIGKVDDLFVDENDREEYFGVKMGLFGMRSTLIPVEVVRVNDRDRSLEVAESKDRVKDAPNFDEDEEITPEFEERIRSHFNLTGYEGAGSRSSYGRGGAAGAETAGTETDRETTDRDTSDRATTDRDWETTGRDRETAGRDRDDDDYRELDVEGMPAGTGEGSSGSAGREEYRDREGASSASGATASGSPSGLETGDRSGERGGERSSGGADGGEAYREGYREGFREGVREAGGLGAGGATGGEERGGQSEAGRSDTGDYEGSSTGSRSSRGETTGTGEGSDRYRDQDRTDAEGGSGETRREDQRRSGEGERSEEGATTKVWRRLRS